MRVGVVGLGHMGAAMARHIHAAGFALTGFLACTLVAGAVQAQTGPSDELLKSPHRMRLVTGGLSHSPVWCGNRAIAVGNSKLGLQWIDVIDGRKKTLDSSPYARPTGCSSGGDWIIYEDKESTRSHYGENRDTLVANFLRVSVSSGRREELAVAPEGGLLSPDGKRVLFFRPVVFPTGNLRQPRWDRYVVTMERPLQGGMHATWLSDSHHVLIAIRHEFWIDKDSRTEPIQPRGDIPGQVLQVQVDTQDRLYVLGELRSGSDRRLLRCRLIAKELECENLDLGVQRVHSYGVSGNGKVIAFIGDGGVTRPERCLGLLRESDAAPRCVWRFAQSRELWLAPDGRRLLLTDSGKVETGTGFYTLDLEQFFAE